MPAKTNATQRAIAIRPDPCQPRILDFVFAVSLGDRYEPVFKTARAAVQARRSARLRRYCTTSVCSIEQEHPAIGSIDRPDSLSMIR
jgi:hypothetical protein